MCRLILITLIALLPTAAGALGLIEGTAGNRLRGKVIAPIANPWAMTFVTPRHLLVTAKTGAVWLVSTDGRKT
ncbi:MAG: PQQ-dependent sugar dehydrogenase, partial [Pseudomonadota bacterium]|nr:PQQ-dependent sugar dehydrogenase [Pseudomonadota bacterium]